MYAQRESFNGIPLNMLFTTSSATINNNSVSVNTQDVLPSLLHLMKEEDLQCSKGMTPTLLDRYQNYSDALNSNNNPINPLGDWKNAGYNNHLLPRGAHSLQSVVIDRNNDPDANPVSQDVVVVVVGGWLWLVGGMVVRVVRCLVVKCLVVWCLVVHDQEFCTTFF